MYIAGDRHTVEVPKKSPAKFRSAIGHLDQRVKLDEKIKTTDKNYKKSLSMMACKLSYENEAFVQTIIKDQWKVSNPASIISKKDLHLFCLSFLILHKSWQWCLMFLIHFCVDGRIGVLPIPEWYVRRKRHRLYI